MVLHISVNNIDRSNCGDSAIRDVVKRFNIKSLHRFTASNHYADLQHQIISIYRIKSLCRFATSNYIADLQRQLVCQYTTTTHLVDVQHDLMLNSC